MHAWTTARKHLTCIDLANQMKELKDTEAEWLKECPSQTLQMALRNLDNAYSAFFVAVAFLNSNQSIKGNLYSFRKELKQTLITELSSYRN